MNSTRMLVVLALGISLFAACSDDGTLPPPPDKPAQIEYDIVQSRGTGLPSSEVTAFINGPGGEFWVGTRGGIARYSSHNDTDADSIVTELTGLPHPQVTSMVEHDGSIYVGTWGGGVGIYNIQDGTWEQLRPGENGLVDGYISDIAVSAPTENRIYFSSNDGVSVLDPTVGTFTHVSTVAPTCPDNGPFTDECNDEDDFDTPALQQLVSCVEVLDTLGIVEHWYGPRVELRPSEIEPGKHGIMVTKASMSYKYTMVNSGLLEPNVNDIYWDRQTNTVWVGYATKGLSNVDTAAKTWTTYDLSDGLASNTVVAITRADDHATSKSAIWAATQGGLSKLVDGSHTWQSYNTGGGLPSSRLHSLYNDGTHLWVGFVDAGAIRIK